jgi:YegS/Rv2252/BmrU family lipid kinase
VKQIYFIINPNAKNGQCLKIWNKVEKELQNEKLPFLAFFTEHPGHAQILAAKIASKNSDEKLIVAVGGDGTLHEVTNGVAGHTNVTLGFIPGGSGNDFSRGFQIPSDPINALKVITRLWKNDGVRIDIGKITMGEEHFFINNMGAGFDATISYEVNHSKMKAIFNKLKMGRLIYFLLKKLFTYKTATIRLSIDGKMHIFEKTWFVTVSNQPYYGGGMQIAPTAIPDDGLFDITVVHQLSKLKLLLVFLSVFWGKHVRFKEVKMYTGNEISIESDSSLFVHADGEHIGTTPLDIHLIAGAVKVLTRMEGKEDLVQKERDLNDFQ